MTNLLFIDGRQQRELADLLEPCPCMKDARKRAIVRKQLDENIQSRINPDGSPDCAVMDMVSGCAFYPDGIEKLVLAVDREDRKTTPMIHLWERLPAVLGFSEPAAHQIVAGLLKSLTAEALGREIVEAAFSASVSEEFRTELKLPGVKSMCSWRLLRETANLSLDKSGRHPFAGFVHRLLPGIADRTTRMELARWAVQVTGEPASFFKAGAKAAAADKRSPERPHLTLRMIPDPTDPERYAVKFHLHRADECREIDPPADAGETEKRSSTQAAALLDRFLLQTFDEDALPKAIEIMIPADRIAALKPPPHHWPLNSGRRRETWLGRKYPVYLRLDRHENRGEALAPDLRRDWKTKWRAFEKAPSPAACIHWEEDPGACSYESLESALCTRNGRPCLMLAFEPKPSPDDPWLEDVLLDAGVPVALWGDGAKADMEKLLKPLFDGGSLRGLPAHLGERRKGAPDKNALPQCLTLLWDNPERDIHGRKTEPTARPRYPMDALA